MNFHHLQPDIFFFFFFFFCGGCFFFFFFFVSVLIFFFFFFSARSSHPTVHPPPSNRAQTMAFLFSIFRRMQSHENQGPVSVPAWLRLIAGLIVYVVFVLIGAAIIMALEKDDEFDATQANRNWNFGSSCYFMVVTTTTIGYGDFSPTTSGGRAFVAIYGLVGLGLVGVSLTVFFFVFFLSIHSSVFFFFFFPALRTFLLLFFSFSLASLKIVLSPAKPRRWFLNIF
jgi:hypothetical protein